MSLTKPCKNLVVSSPNLKESLFPHLLLGTWTSVHSSIVAIFPGAHQSLCTGLNKTKSKTKCTQLPFLNKESRRTQIWLNENSNKYLDIWKGQRRGQGMTLDKWAPGYLTEASVMHVALLGFRSVSLPCSWWLVTLPHLSRGRESWTLSGLYIV